MSFCRKKVFSARYFRSIRGRRPGPLIRRDSGKVSSKAPKCRVRSAHKFAEKTQGEAGQLGGVLIAHGEKVLYKHKEQYAGDHAPLNEILKAVGYDEETANRELAQLFSEVQTHQ